MGDTYAAKLGRIADEMDEGPGDRREWAEGIRRVLADRADERGRWVAHIQRCEETIRGHKEFERGLKARLAEAEAEAGRLRRELARPEDQTHSYPTEAELSPETRARLMPEGMEWPRFEDGGLVRLNDKFIYAPNGFSWVKSVRFDLRNEKTVISGDASYDVAVFEFGERVKRPEPPATASRGCRDTVAPDSWERLEEDCGMQARDYCEAHGVDAPRGSDCGPLMRRDLLRRARALAGGPDAHRPGEVV